MAILDIDFHHGNGQQQIFFQRLIGGLKIPVLVVQEGGYKHQSLGSLARAFFNGLYQSFNN